MNILLIQENGRHDANRNFRECFSLSRAFARFGHNAEVWGLGHQNFERPIDFNAFDLILNLENYDQTGWLPDLGGVSGPIKMLWAVDEHVRGSEYYATEALRGKYDYVLHSTRDYVKSNRDFWIPNCVDDDLVRPLKCAKRADVGFCGNVNNRKPWLDALAEKFQFTADIFVIGDAMVQAVNSYKVAFNRNISNDVNARSFEIIGCGVPLITNWNQQYDALGFRHKENCVFYKTESELLDGVRWLLADDQRRAQIGDSGLILSRGHTYYARATSILNIALSRRAQAADSREPIVMQASPISRALRAIPDNEATSVSVCVITNAGALSNRHREVYLHRLLNSVRLAGFPADVEIIVAGAVPPGLQTCKNISLADAATAGRICELRNELADAANGNVIVQVDDDVLFSRGYWDAVSAAPSDWDILCTRLLNPNGTRYWDWAAYYPGKGQTLLPYDAVDDFVYATGGHALYRRGCFKNVRWNEARCHGQNEEFDFAAAARGAKLRYRFCRDATVFLQYHHCDVESVIRQAPQKTSSESPLFTITANLAEQGRYFEARHSVLSEPICHKVEDRGDSRCAVSLLVGCYRYLRRLKVFVDSILRQKFPLQHIEVIVANPCSPDGLSEYLASLREAGCSRRFPVIKEVLLPRSMLSNRGAMIQNALEASTSPIVIGMDCDLVLPANFVEIMTRVVTDNPDRLVGVYRNFLTRQTTDRILSGGIDPVEAFEKLSTEDEQEQDGYRGVLGYCQAARREVWTHAGYPVEYNSIAKSDVAFVERLSELGFKPLFLKDVRVLHLHHSRNWNGTEIDL